MKTSIRIKARLIALIFIAFSATYICGQNISIADSLESIYTSGEYKEEDKLKILRKLAYNHPDPERSLKYSEELLRTAQALDSLEYILNGFLQIGTALRLKGDLNNALDHYFQAAKIATEKGENRQLGVLYIAIAGVYSVMGNHQNTVQYYKDAIDILKVENDSLSYAGALENLGDEYNLNLADPDSALIFFKQSGAIYNALNYEIGIAYNTGNVGLAYAQKGMNDIAEMNINQAIDILNNLGDYYPICVYLLYMTDIYQERGDHVAALKYALRSLDLAQKYGLKDQVSDANLKLSDLYEIAGDYRKSSRHYKDYIVYRDSVINIESVQKIAELRTDYEVSQKQVEIDLLEKEAEIQQLNEKRQRNIIYASGITFILVFLLGLGMYRRYYYIKKTKLIIEEEKDRSEKLLRNILPEETAVELKQNGKVEAKKFDSVTVLFTDFEQFTHFAENLSPEELVKSIDFYFSKFDEIIEKYGLEKIKTVGDSYMCAGGLPFITQDHPVKVVQAAIEIADFVNETKRNNPTNQTCFDIRLGINTGPVIAGVVGTKKFAYDIWGDTVNIASRMESNSERGKINISENTFDLISDLFDCKHRGEIEVRNKGKMKMYFVDRQNKIHKAKHV